MIPALTAAKVRKPKHTILPLLVFLFAVSYGLVVMLIVLQDRTIDAQADIIHLLFKENYRLHAVSNTHKSAAPNVKPRPSQSSAHEQIPSPRAQAPSTQVQASPNVSQIPSSQEKPAGQAKPGQDRHKTRKRNPFRPPAEVTDPSDMRRSLITI